MSTPSNTPWFIWFSLLYLLLASFYLFNPQVVLTHYHNSEITFLKARDMAEGKHDWGMFFDGEDKRTPRYEFHMPEGPTYLMALWLMAGLPERGYRVIPILTSLLAHLFLLKALLTVYGAFISKKKIFFVFGWITLQPMVVAWSKAVDDGSYNISLMVLMLGLTILQTSSRWWLYLLLGFLLGSQEFYRQPMMMLLLWFTEFLRQHERGKSFLPSLGRGFLMASLAGVGVVAGLVVHILQLALVWNNWGDAWNEMAGAFLGRASIPNDLNPEFYEAKLQDQVGFGAPTEFVRLKTIAKIFIAMFWFDATNRIYTWPIIGIGGLLYGLWSQTGLGMRHHLHHYTKGQWALLIFFIFLIPNIWTLLMPNHASIHYYYISRDYIGFYWALFFLGLNAGFFRNFSNMKS